MSLEEFLACLCPLDQRQNATDTFFKHRGIERVALGHQEVEGDSALECKLSGVDMSKGPSNHQ